jgi:hypothetical protein
VKVELAFDRLLVITKEKDVLDVELLTSLCLLTVEDVGARGRCRRSWRLSQQASS